MLLSCNRLGAHSERKFPPSSFPSVSTKGLTRISVQYKETGAKGREKKKRKEGTATESEISANKVRNWGGEGEENSFSTIFLLLPIRTGLWGGGWKMRSGGGRRLAGGSSIKLPPFLPSPNSLFSPSSTPHTKSQLCLLLPYVSAPEPSKPRAGGPLTTHCAEREE